MSQQDEPGVPLREEDLECPICMSLLTDPFVTTCGHTFCHRCLMTHLQTGKSCPSCSSTISKAAVYPNFLLSEILKKVHRSSSGGPPTAFEGLQHLVSQAKPSLSVSQLDTLLEQLSAYRKEAEDAEKEDNMDLLLQFLQHSREDKARKLAALQQELECLENDIGRVEGTVDRTIDRNGTLGAGTTRPLLSPTSTGVSSFAENRKEGQGAAMVGQPTSAYAMQQAALATAQQQQQHAFHPLGVSTDASLLGQQRNAPPSPHLQPARDPQDIGATGFPVPLQPGQQPVPTQETALAAAMHRMGPQYSPAAYTALANHPGMATYINTQLGAPSPAAAPTPLQSSGAAAAAATAAAAPGSGAFPHGTSSTSASEDRKDPVGMNKRKRLAAQFEDLQSAYLRLRADRLKGGSNNGTAATGGGAASEVDGEAVPHGKGTAAPGGGGASSMSGAVVDEGLQEFSRLLSVLSSSNRLIPIAEIPRPSLRQASSIISSVEFDRHGSLFATAGVSKRISVFEHAAVVRSPGTLVHCPVIEMVTRSKLSCLSWNKYVASHLASSDYEGVVTIWDVNTSGMVQEYEAHAKRIWSVDFCGADPVLLASGSDDCSVKLWSSRAQASVAQLDLRANVCAVKWRPGSAHELAVGTADHNCYIFDLRRPARPLASFSGHRKAVSYVRWMGENSIVSASTDSTLRLWDAAAAIATGVGGESERIYEGHSNEKIFVGLAVEGDFLACGSETNEAFVYFKPLSKPVARLGFGDGGPFGIGSAGAGVGGTNRSSAGDGADLAANVAAEDKAFISAVCWRPGGQELLVADSQGTVRILQLS